MTTEYSTEAPDHAAHQHGYEPHRGQARMAYRLASAYASRLMYVGGIGWHVWDGQRWAEDERGAAKNAVLDILRQALVDSIDDKELRSDVRKCESASGINGVLDIASALPALRATVGDLDADPLLLNCSNGTLDLGSRSLRPHDPRDRITRVARGAYIPGSGAGMWDRFLERVLPDADERGYFQRVIGQGVYGRIRENLFPVLTGSGANGKSTAYGAIVNAFGDYASVMDPAMLMADGRKGGPELMTLLGRRLVVGSETDEGRKLDAATMKRLTGGDELTARKLYHEPVAWKPSHTIVYVTNHLPKVKGNDPALWRRMRVIPFGVVIPDSEKDPKLGEQLELHADAILTWAVEGWFDYVARGERMDDPEKVTAATGDYQTESDPVKRFVSDMCTTVPGVYAMARDLYSAWVRWAAADGSEPGSEKAFGEELDRLGFPVTGRSSSGKKRGGIALKAEGEEPD